MHGRPTPDTPPTQPQLQSVRRRSKDNKHGISVGIRTTQPGVDVSSQDPVNSFGARDTLAVGDNSYEIYRLDAVPGTEKLPYSLKVLAENLLRTEDGANITSEHIAAIANWDPSAAPSSEVQFTP